MSSGFPTVSVLMTAFNREALLSEAIESILCQSFGDWELIIVDDLSSDRTFEIARAYAATDPRLRVFRNAINLGDYPNRNYAASLARGMYITYLDSDDILYRHSLATSVEMMNQYPEACMGISLGGRFIGHRCPVFLSPTETIKYEFLGPGGLLASGPCSAIFRRDLFEVHQGFEYRGAASDVYFWLKLWPIHPILILPADLYWPRSHGGQESATVAASEAYLQMCIDIWDFINTSEIFGECERAIARKNWLAAVRRWIFQDVRSGHFARAWTRFRQISLRFWLTSCRRPDRTYRIRPQ